MFKLYKVDPVTHHNKVLMGKAFEVQWANGLFDSQQNKSANVIPECERVCI